MKNLYRSVPIGLSFIFTFLLITVMTNAHTSSASTSLKELTQTDSKSTGTLLPKLQTTLYGVYANNTTYTADGVLNNYADCYSNDIDDDDALKLLNPGENLSIKRCNQLLVIERRHTIANNDTIFLNLTGTRAQKYRFECIGANLQPNLVAYLEDSYQQTKTLLNLTGATTLDFSVANIAGSNAANRFMIVLMPANVLPLTFISSEAYRQNQYIAVEWKTANESNMKQYEVEKSYSGSNFKKTGMVAAKNTTLNSYNWLDAQVTTGYNYYRIKSIDLNGEKRYSDVMKVLIESANHQIAVYPNPVINNTINLHLVNQPYGNYMVKLLNSEGQQVLTTTVQHQGGSSIEFIPTQKLPKGIYQLQVITTSQSITTNKLIF